MPYVDIARLKELAALRLKLGSEKWVSGDNRYDECLWEIDKLMTDECFFTLIARLELVEKREIDAMARVESLLDDVLRLESLNAAAMDANDRHRRDISNLLADVLKLTAERDAAVGRAEALEESERDERSKNYVIMASLNAIVAAQSAAKGKSE